MIRYTTYGTNCINSFEEFGITIEQYNSLDLTDVQRETLNLRFGLGPYGFLPMTWTEISKIRNVSSPNVRATFIRGCEKIFEQLHSIERAVYKSIENDLMDVCISLSNYKALSNNYIFYGYYKK